MFRNKSKRRITHIIVAVVQLISHVQLFLTPWTVPLQAPLSSAISQSSFTFMPIESMMLSDHIVLCLSLLLLPSIFPSIKVFSESALHIRWPKYWSFSFSNSPSNEYSGKIPWRRKWQPPPVFLPGKSHGQRSLVGYSPCGWKELDTTEQLNNPYWSNINLSPHFFLSPKC